MLLRILTLAFGLFGAAVLSQAPEFAQQYLQRLAGASDELSAQIEALDARAADQSLNRYDYIRRFLANQDSAIRAEGQALSDLLARDQNVRQALEAMRAAPLFLFPWTAATHMDPVTVWRTADDYKPAMPLTASGALHAGAGFVTLALVFRMLVFLLRPRRRARQEPRLR